MDTNECSLCRPGGFVLTRQMFQFAGIEIPEAGAAETESTDPAVPLRVIDIGCGTGGTMRWLSEHFPDWQISGLDKNPDVHEPGWIETGCAEKLPYPDQTADIILLECSCSKAADPAAALREVYRVLKPEGWLLMSDMYARKKELFLDGMLGRLESAKTIRDRLAEAGDCKDAGRVGNIGGVDRAADLRWKSGIRLRGAGGGTKDFKRSGLRLFYCGGAAVRVMADTFVCKGEKSILSEEIYIRLGTAWENGRFRCTARAGFVFMGGFPHTSPHNPGGTESGAGNIFMCSSQGDRADHHAENLRQYRGAEAPVFYRRRSDADGGFL